MLNREELNQVKDNLYKRYRDGVSPEVSDFFADITEYDTCAEKREAEHVLEVIESAELLAADKEIDRLSDRLLPLQCEWPRFTDGKRVRFGDWIQRGNESFQLKDLTFSEDGSIGINNDFECGYEMCIDKHELLIRGEAPKPPEPPCKDRNGEIIHEGDTVYCSNGSPLTVKEIHRLEWLSEYSFLLEFENTPLRLYSGCVTKKRIDCVDQIIEEIESGKLTAASCIKARLEAIKERKGDDFGY